MKPREKQDKKSDCAYKEALRWQRAIRRITELQQQKKPSDDDVLKLPPPIKYLSASWTLTEKLQNALPRPSLFCHKNAEKGKGNPAHARLPMTTLREEKKEIYNAHIAIIFRIIKITVSPGY